MNHINFLASLSLSLLLIAGCRQGDTGRQETAGADGDFSYELIVQKDGLRLRAEAGPEGEVLKSLTRGEKLKDLGETSAFTSRIQLEGQTYHEPWIRVQTASGEKGWVYARAQDFELAAGEDPLKWTYQKRLSAYFGPEKTAELAAYQEAFQSIRSSADFAEAYGQGKKLRTELVQALERQTASLEVEERPDLFWLAEVIPAFVPQLVAEGTAYYLFEDYRQWLRQAGQTAEPQDDAFIQFCISIFPQDSVEYFFPVWQIQTWDYGGHSLLGRGHHLAALRAIDGLGRQSKLFQPYLQGWKQDLIDDITAMETTYWEERPAATQELKQIIGAGLGYLTRDDKVALETRLKQFENAGQYDEKFNHKSGLH